MSIERKSILDCRYYHINEEKINVYYPSVTTILGKMGDNSWLKSWQDRIGKDNADKISKFSANRGTVMHSYNENYVRFAQFEKDKRKLLSLTLEKTLNEVKENFESKEIEVGRKLFFNFYNSGAFNKINKPILQEQYLYSDKGGGYAGTVDLIYEDLEGKHVVSDYKSSKKPKNIDDIESYKKQISAYFIAYYIRTNNIPSYGEIWISNEYDFIPQIIRIDLEEIKRYYKLFIEDVKKFHAIYDVHLDTYLKNV